MDETFKLQGIEKVAPELVRDYLLSNGWKQFGYSDPRCEVFGWMSDIPTVLLPVDRKLSDFHALMESAVAAIAGAEGRSTYVVLQKFLPDDEEENQVDQETLTLAQALHTHYCNTHNPMMPGWFEGISKNWSGLRKEDKDFFVQWARNSQRG